MANPWEEISLDDYEGHMSLESVKQLQALNSIMAEQFDAYPVQSAMVLGAAGGNGLEHIKKDKYRAVYAVDINAEYLKAAAGRFAALGDVLKCLRLDLEREAGRLPRAELVIADLLIEYIGYPAFREAIRRAAPKYVSCVIQINTDPESWVSDSPYLHAFDGLDAIHHQIDGDGLIRSMGEIGYSVILRDRKPLPNGKALERLDFAPGCSGETGT